MMTNSLASDDAHFATLIVPLGRFVAPSQKAAIDQRLDEIVMRALERDLPHRYQHASEMKVEVERVSDSGATPQPRGEGEPQPHAMNQQPGSIASNFGSRETHVRIFAMDLRTKKPASAGDSPKRVIR